MSLANSTMSFIQNVQDMLMDSFPLKPAGSKLHVSSTVETKVSSS